MLHVFSEPVDKGGLLWRMSSGLYNTSKSAVSGTVGMGVGGVKWVAGTSYNVTAGVVSGTSYSYINLYTEESC